MAKGMKQARLYPGRQLILRVRARRLGEERLVPALRRPMVQGFRVRNARRENSVLWGFVVLHTALKAQE